MVAGKIISCRTQQTRTYDEVIARAVKPDHIEIGDSELCTFLIKVASNSDCLQENLRHNHGRTPIERHSAVSQLCNIIAMDLEVIL